MRSQSIVILVSLFVTAITGQGWDSLISNNSEPKVKTASDQTQQDTKQTYSVRYEPDGQQRDDATVLDSKVESEPKMFKLSKDSPQAKQTNVFASSGAGQSQGETVDSNISPYNTFIEPIAVQVSSDGSIMYNDMLHADNFKDTTKQDSNTQDLTNTSVHGAKTLDAVLTSGIPEKQETVAQTNQESVQAIDAAPIEDTLMTSQNVNSSSAGETQYITEQKAVLSSIENKVVDRQGTAETKTVENAGKVTEDKSVNIISGDIANTNKSDMTSNEKVVGTIKSLDNSSTQETKETVANIDNAGIIIPNALLVDLPSTYTKSQNENLARNTEQHQTKTDLDTVFNQNQDQTVSDIFVGQNAAQAVQETTKIQDMENVVSENNQTKEQTLSVVDSVADQNQNQSIKDTIKEKDITQAIADSVATQAGLETVVGTEKATSADVNNIAKDKTEVVIDTAVGQENSHDIVNEIAGRGHSQSVVTGLEQNQAVVKTVGGQEQSQTVIDTVAGHEETQAAADTVAEKEQLQAVEVMNTGQEQTLAAVDTVTGHENSQAAVDNVDGQVQSQTVVDAVSGQEQSQPVVDTVAGHEQSQVAADTVAVKEQIKAVEVMNAGQEQTPAAVDTVIRHENSQAVVDNVAGQEQSQTMVDAAAGQEQLEPVIDTVAGQEQSQTVVDAVAVQEQSQPVVDTVDVKEQLKAVEVMNAGQEQTLAAAVDTVTGHENSQAVVDNVAGQEQSQTVVDAVSGQEQLQPVVNTAAGQEQSQAVEDYVTGQEQKQAGVDAVVNQDPSQAVVDTVVEQENPQAVVNTAAVVDSVSLQGQSHDVKQDQTQVVKDAIVDQGQVQTDVKSTVDGHDYAETGTETLSGQSQVVVDMGVEQGQIHTVQETVKGQEQPNDVIDSTIVEKSATQISDKTVSNEVLTPGAVGIVIPNFHLMDTVISGQQVATKTNSVGSVDAVKEGVQTEYGVNITDISKSGLDEKVQTIPELSVIKETSQFGLDLTNGKEAVQPLPDTVVREEGINTIITEETLGTVEGQAAQVTPDISVGKEPSYADIHKPIGQDVMQSNTDTVLVPGTEQQNLKTAVEQEIAKAAMDNTVQDTNVDGITQETSQKGIQELVIENAQGIHNTSVAEKKTQTSSDMDVGKDTTKTESVNMGLPIFFDMGMGIAEDSATQQQAVIKETNPVVESGVAQTGVDTQSVSETGHTVNVQNNKETQTETKPIIVKEPVQAGVDTQVAKEADTINNKPDKKDQIIDTQFIDVVTKPVGIQVVEEVQPKVDSWSVDTMVVDATDMGLDKQVFNGDQAVDDTQAFDTAKLGVDTQVVDAAQVVSDNQTANDVQTIVDSLVMAAAQTGVDKQVEGHVALNTQIADAADKYNVSERQTGIEMHNIDTVQTGADTQNIDAVPIGVETQKKDPVQTGADTQNVDAVQTGVDTQIVDAAQMVSDTQTATDVQTIVDSPVMAAAQTEVAKQVEAHVALNTQIADAANTYGGNEVQTGIETHIVDAVQTGVDTQTIDAVPIGVETQNIDAVQTGANTQKVDAVETGVDTYVVDADQMVSDTQTNNDVHTIVDSPVMAAAQTGVDKQVEAQVTLNTQIADATNTYGGNEVQTGIETHIVDAVQTGADTQNIDSPQTRADTQNIDTPQTGADTPNIAVQTGVDTQVVDVAQNAVDTPNSVAVQTAIHTRIGDAGQLTVDADVLNEALKQVNMQGFSDLHPGVNTQFVNEALASFDTQYINEASQAETGTFILPDETYTSVNKTVVGSDVDKLNVQSETDQQQNVSETIPDKGQTVADLAQVPPEVPGYIQTVAEVVPDQVQTVAEVVPGEIQTVAEVVPGEIQTVAEVVPGEIQTVAEVVPGQVQSVPEVVPDPNQHIIVDSFVPPKDQSSNIKAQMVVEGAILDNAVPGEAVTYVGPEPVAKGDTQDTLASVSNVLPDTESLISSGSQKQTHLLKDVLTGKQINGKQVSSIKEQTQTVADKSGSDVTTVDLKAEFQDLGIIPSNKDTGNALLSREADQIGNLEKDPIPDVNEALQPETSGPPLESLCEYSSFIDSIGYAEYPGRCDKLVQCYNYRGRDIAVLRDCPYGYFWHQEQVLCRPPAEVPCYDDPCLDIDVVQYNRSGGCRSYYACEYGISIPQCCDKGFRFVDMQCIPDATCYDPCSTPYDIENQMRYQSCKFLPDEYNPYGYITMEHNGLRIRACPSGTVFSARQCGCRSIGKGSSKYRQSRRRMNQCKPQFAMDFDQGFKEDSGSNMAFDVSNVVITDGAAQFDGKGKITLWGFMNKELGTRFAIRLRFKPDPTSTDRGSLISNCGMTGSPTVSIDLQKHMLVSSAKSKSFTSPTKIKDHFDPYSWNDITYVYDGRNFMVLTNGYKQRKPLGGLLETRSNAIVIGGCPRPGKGYKGLIDSVEIYSGCVPRDILKKRNQR